MRCERTWEESELVIRGSFVIDLARGFADS